MKKAQLAMLGISAVTSIAALLPQDAFATVTCTSATGANVPLTCSGATGSGTVLASGFALYSGSNGVQMSVADSATVAGFCASHIRGGNHFGITTAGGSMQVATGTAITGATGSGCS